MNTEIIILWVFVILWYLVSLTAFCLCGRKKKHTNKKRPHRKSIEEAAREHNIEVREIE